jgi:hypothetical protein
MYLEHHPSDVLARQIVLANTTQVFHNLVNV